MTQRQLRMYRLMKRPTTLLTRGTTQCPLQLVLLSLNLSTRERHWSV